jgi:ABC-type sugar transport system, permease component
MTGNAARRDALLSRSARFTRTFIIRFAFYFLLMSLSFIFLYPFITMIAKSLMTDDDLYNMTVKWLPSEVTWTNYAIAFRRMRFRAYVWNNVIVGFSATAGHAISCALTGYAFARYKFKLKGPLFVLVILMMIVPVQVIIFPLYRQYSNWKVLNTFVPLIAPCFFGFGLNGGFFIFLFRQFFSGLPYEMEEAARVDGCGPIRTYLRIMLPMAQAPMLVCFLLSLVWHWNDYFEPTVYITNPDLRMLPSILPTLYALLGQENFTMIQVSEMEGVMFNNAMLMAATFLCIIPIMIIYLILQRRFMEGVERSGLTGM